MSLARLPLLLKYGRPRLRRFRGAPPSAPVPEPSSATVSCIWIMRYHSPIAYKEGTVFADYYAIVAIRLTA